jgi:predicted anti-sigma-YlaC factor YlaD
VTADDPRALSNAALEARLHALQQEAFALYETAAAAADAGDGDGAFVRAERDTAPLIAEARRLNDERVRRLRARARRWRYAAVAVAIVGVLLVLWLLQRQGAGS